MGNKSMVVNDFNTFQFVKPSFKIALRYVVDYIFNDIFLSYILFPMAQDKTTQHYLKACIFSHSHRNFTYSFISQLKIRS